jgi:hypothetical protein
MGTLSCLFDGQMLIQILISSDLLIMHQVQVHDYAITDNAKEIPTCSQF